MPTVPTMGEGPQIAPMQVSGIRSNVSPQDFGAGMARTVQGVAGAVASDYFDELKEAKAQADSLRMMDKRNKLAEKLSPKIAEWNQRKGEDTLKSAEESRTFIQESADELANDLPPHLRDPFLAYAKGEQVQVGRSLMVHSSAQMEQLKNTAYKARMETLNNQVVMSRLDNDMSDVLIAKGMAETIEWMKMNGVKQDSDIAKSVISSVASGLGRKRVEALFQSGNDLIAQEVGKRYIDDKTIVGDDRLKVEGMIETSSQIIKVDKLLAEVAVETSGKENEYQAAMEIITSETHGDEKYRAKARDEYQIRWRVKKEAEKEHEAHATKTIYEIINKDNGSTTDEGKAEAYKLGGAEMVDKYLKYAHSFNASRQTDGMAFTQLRMFAREGELSKMSSDAFYRRFYNRFSPGDWNKAVEIYDFETMPQTLSAAQIKDNQKSQAGFLSTQEHIDNVLTTWNMSMKQLDKLPDSTSNREKKAEGSKLYLLLNQALSNYAESKAKEGAPVYYLTPKEIDAVISPVLMNVAMSKNGLPGMKPVPQEAIQRIKDRSREKNAVVLTDEEAKEVYYRAIAAGRNP